MLDDSDEIAIAIEPASELGMAIAAAGKNPVRLMIGDQQYVATRDPLKSADHSDPEEIRAALRAAAGMFTPEEGDRLKRMIYPWRDEEGPRIDPPELDTDLALAAVRTVMGPLAEDDAGRIKALMHEGYALRSRQTDAS